MEYTELGKTNLKISRIGMGCWQAAGWSSSDDNKFIKTVHAALSNGITLFDTSPLYGNGHSEKLLSRALEGERENVTIATKFFVKQNKIQAIRNALENSLQSLNTDYIDLYQHHWPTSALPLGDVIDMLETLRREGKIRAIGVSNWMEPEWEEFSNYEKIDSLQPCYNLLWRSIEKNVLPLCKTNKISILPYSPLCQGILAGKYRDPNEFPKDVRAQNIYFNDKKLQELSEVIKKLNELASKYNKTLAQISLRWLLQKEGVTAPLVGMSSPEYVKNNILLFDWELEKNELTELDQLTNSFSENLSAHDTLWNWHPKKQ